MIPMPQDWCGWLGWHREVAGSRHVMLAHEEIRELKVSNPGCKGAWGISRETPCRGQGNSPVLIVTEKSRDAWDWNRGFWKSCWGALLDRGLQSTSCSEVQGGRTGMAGAGGGKETWSWITKVLQANIISTLLRQRHKSMRDFMFRTWGSGGATLSSHGFPQLCAKRQGQRQGSRGGHCCHHTALWWWERARPVRPWDSV